MGNFVNLKKVPYNIVLYLLSERWLFMALDNKLGIEIKYILKNALTDKINDRDVYMKVIDNIYYYEGYVTYKKLNFLE